MVSRIMEQMRPSTQRHDTSESREVAMKQSEAENKGGLKKPEGLFAERFSRRALSDQDINDAQPVKVVSKIFSLVGSYNMLMVYVKEGLNTRVLPLPVVKVK